MRLVLRSSTVMLALLTAAACSGPARFPTTQTSSSGTAGSPADGIDIVPLARVVPLDALVAGVWDGSRLWLLDVDGRLRAVDGSSGEPVIEVSVNPTPEELSLLGQKLVGVGQAQPGVIQVVSIESQTGKVVSRRVDGGQPLGQGIVRGGELIVADYERGVVALQPDSGETRVVLATPFVPNLLQASERGTFWVVDDGRRRLARLDVDGRSLVDLDRPQAIIGLAADSRGNAWIAERTKVTAFGSGGETLREIGGLVNAVRIRACGGSIVVSDTEPGVVQWLSVDSSALQVDTGVPGGVVACAPGGVWYVGANGDLFRLERPPA